MVVSSVSDFVVVFRFVVFVGAKPGLSLFDQYTNEGCLRSIILDLM
jgi:hypothetical protein